LQPFLEHVPQPWLFKAKLLFDHPKRILHLGAEVRYGGLDQVIHSPSGGIWYCPAFAWGHGNAEAVPPALHLFSLINSLVASIRRPQLPRRAGDQRLG
jgi:hypothetical protein